MGLPATSNPEPTEALSLSVNPTPSAPVNPSVPKPVESLPSAALDLASKLFDLARAGDTSTLNTYISAGIPKNLTNHAGDTLLMLSAYHGHAETVSMLLAAGADPNVMNDRGQSPLAGAVFKGYDEVVRVLVEGNADKELGTPNAVDCARMFKRYGYLKLFGVETEGAFDDRVLGGVRS